MSTAHELTPRTRAVRAADVRPGHIVMESHEHPAVVVRVERPHNGTRIRLYCRFVWQASTEPTWAMPEDHTLRADDIVQVARNR
ncbi:hypothetical protein [Microbacterium pumilum]|uniref:Uncharacterized protein n=1 Tax=Microbacterium pumilum TaxID=344165 RepID=A0ABN2T3C5_9MICO